MKQLSNLYIFFIIIVMCTLVVAILFFNQESKKDRLQELTNHVRDEFDNALSAEKADLLSFALALSEDGALKNALLANDTEKANTILRAISERFKEYTHIKKLRLRIIDIDFFIFAQNWGQASVGLPISWFRDDLKKLQYDKRPKVGTETGRILTLKATIPLRNARDYIGYLEVIKFIDEFAEKLHKRGIELFALMDKKHLKHASLMRNFPFLNEYVIVNQNYNKKLKIQAESIDWKILRKKGYYYRNEALYLLESMYNEEKQKIGKYLIVLPEKSFEQYQKKHQNVTFSTRLSDEAVYDVVQLWEKPAGCYRSMNDKKLIEWLPKLDKRGKEALRPKAKQILENYTRDELIDIILETKHKEEKIGVIQ